MIIMAMDAKSFSRIARRVVASAIVVSAIMVPASSSAQSSASSSAHGSTPAAAEGCEYSKPRTAKQVSGDPKLNCARRCTGSVAVLPPGTKPGTNVKDLPRTAVGVVDEELSIGFLGSDPLGGDDQNMLCGSKGSVSWGDGGDDEPFSSVFTINCEGKEGSKISQGGYEPDLWMKHTFSKPGMYCVSAQASYTSRARDAACSFDCTEEGYIRVKINPKSTASAKEAK
jgi:hypothetical protein